jgi:hypothetical protein
LTFYRVFRYTISWRFFMDNRISLHIPTAELDAARNHLEQALAILLPYLIALTPDEAEALFKVSDKGSVFVEKSLAYSKSNPEFAPKFLNVAEFDADVTGAAALLPLLKLLQQLLGPLSDTITLSRSEAAGQALLYYHSVKQAAASSLPGAAPIYDDLRKRFPGRPPKKASG